jgi:hypothetical protein
VQVSSEEEALNLLFLGDTNRAISETAMNQVMMMMRRRRRMVVMMRMMMLYKEEEDENDDNDDDVDVNVDVDDGSSDDDGTTSFFRIDGRQPRILCGRRRRGRIASSPSRSRAAR